MLHTLFDIDETILSMPPGVNDRTSAIMFKKVFGITAHEEMIDNFGKTEMKIIREVLTRKGIRVKQVPEEAYESWAQAIKEELSHQSARVLPGVCEVLGTLNTLSHVRVELLTGNALARTQVKLDATNLSHFFRKDKTSPLRGVFGDLTEERADLFPLVKQRAGRRDRYVIIDDSLIGARLARTHALPLIAVATGRATIAQLRVFTPYVFPDFGDDRWRTVVSIIEKLIE